MVRLYKVYFKLKIRLNNLFIKLMWLKSDIPYISSSISSIEDLCNMKLCLNSERLKKGPLTLKKIDNEKINMTIALKSDL